MNLKLLNYLVCPNTGSSLILQDEIYENGLVKTGKLCSENLKFSYVIENYIPRFVEFTNYADSFGWQWNIFSKTQLDSFSGHPITKKRFWSATNWDKSSMKGQWILDAGCGSGRFAEVALTSGANLIVIDYSNSVDACYKNLGQHENLHIIQADIYKLPFKPRFFDRIYSLGVLQHTPNVEEAFFSLVGKLSMGGRLCVDFYEKSFKSSLLPKYWLRPFTTKVEKEKLFSCLKQYVPRMLKISNFLGSIPLFGKYLKRLIPVANYYGILPLDEKQQIEWALLDTFDWLSPAYDNPQNSKTVQLWFTEANFSNIEILKSGHLVGRGILK
jgi:2-polyprenyl-3-methyl-5-hydroxy-6-metoxy-1,4-benzoquinol methylase